MRHEAKTLITLMGGALVGLSSMAALAEDESAQEISRSQIDEIIVTARKSVERLQDIPLAVSVQSAEMLDQSQITDASSLQMVTPSLQAQSGYALAGAPTFAIRGVGTSVIGPQVESSVGIVVDDVPMARTALANVEFFDIDRVEILRGPQGMLFGKNASAGLINIVTRQPRISDTEFAVRAQYENMNSVSSGNRYRFNMATSVPVNERTAVRVSGFYARDGAMVENTLDPNLDLGKDTFGLQAKIAFEPSDRLKFLLQGDHTYISGFGEAAFAQSHADPAGATAVINAIDGIVPARMNPYIAANGDFDNWSRVYGTSFKFEAGLSDSLTLTNVTAYRRHESFTLNDADTTSFSIFDPQVQDRYYRQISQELRLGYSGGGPLSFQAGLFFLDLKGNLGGAYNINVGQAIPPPFTHFIESTQTSRIDNTSYAAFFESPLRLSERLTATAGARFTHDKLDYSYTVVNTGMPVMPVAEYANPSADKVDNMSYRFSLDYKIDPDVMVYASYARGYKGPTFDITTADNVKEELSDNYEIGLKATLFDRAVTLNLAGFYEEFDGFQTQATSLSRITDLPTITTVNAGQLQIKGLEAEVALVPFQGLTIRGGLTYLDSEYKKLDHLPCYPGQPVGAGQNECRSSDPTLPAPFNGAFYPYGVTSASGNSLAQAAEWTETVSIRYETLFGSRWTAFVQGDGFFRSAYNFTALPDPQTRMPAVQIYGASAGIKSDDSRWTVTFFARNLTNERLPSYVLQGAAGNLLQDNSFGRSGVYVQQFSPDSFRRFGLSIDYRM